MNIPANGNDTGRFGVVGVRGLPRRRCRRSAAWFAQEPQGADSPESRQPRSPCAPGYGRYSKSLWTVWEGRSVRVRAGGGLDRRSDKPC